jgi:NADP-dependent 3-hydroxy acid dehydrogenase YdfG
MNGRMKNLVAVVTGGGSGFGESICGSSPIKARVWSSRT